MDKANIILIYADDLGRGMLSSYGQKHFSTPNIDRIAREGIRFERAYGTAFCAPARASLLCGIHDAHAGRWTYTPGGVYKKLSTGEMTQDEAEELIQNTGIQNRSEGNFLPGVLKQAGYRTGQVGKLEWGFATTAGELKDHGWDYHYGYYDHIRCHGFYPPFLFENGKKNDIPGNTDPHCGRPEYTTGDVPANTEAEMSGRQVYSQDLFDTMILDFIGSNRENPFFLFHPTQLPHGPAFYPAHHPGVAGNSELTDIEKEYASMVLRLDDTVGLILDELERLHLRDKTLLIFSSDNGHENSYYSCKGRTGRNRTLKGEEVNDRDRPFRTIDCGDPFDGNRGLAGLKFTNWDGGSRVLWMASMPGRIPEGEQSNQLISNYDCMATLAELAGTDCPATSDGISFLPALFGRTAEEEHEEVIFASAAGPAMVTKEGWKLRFYIPGDVFAANSPTPDKIPFHPGTIRQLYKVDTDPAETEDLSDQYPDLLQELTERMIRHCDGNLYNGTPQAHLAGFSRDIPDWPRIFNNEI
ncbi:MAG: sulfatase-like hydrolase/transferase [Spirochaetales bacterium]|nr:sulfatase-like hydrolase/transferase [Spirochaetales bacterium]